MEQRASFVLNIAVGKTRKEKRYEIYKSPCGADLLPVLCKEIKKIKKTPAKESFYYAYLILK